MNDAAANGETAVAAAQGPQGAGAVLLKERRRQGLSLGDISRQLKLTVRQVEAIERDDYSAYKGPVFIHGFIRNYAKLLGLDPQPLILATDSMLNSLAARAEAAREPEQFEPVPMEKRSRRFWPGVAVLFLVGIALAIYFAGRRAPDAPPRTPAVATIDKPAPASKIATESKTQPKTESSERRSAVAVQEAVPVESAGQVTVRMVFEQDSWVQIKDRAGNTIFGQLNAAGSRRSVSGEPPLSVVVGNAAGVHLFRGGDSVDLAPHTRVDVARLTLE